MNTRLCELKGQLKKLGMLIMIKRITYKVLYKVLRRPYTFFLLKCSRINDDQIFFHSIPDFTDNSECLFEYLYFQKKYEMIRFVWLIDDYSNYLKYKRIYNTNKRVSIVSFRANPFEVLKAIATSQYIFFTHASPFQYIAKRKGQLSINLWHGCGYKDTEMKGKSYIEQSPFDYALVPGDVFVETKTKFWGCKKEQILPIGYPRYDLLNKEDEKALYYAKSLKGCSDKLLMWMPTFRNTDKADFPEQKLQSQYDLPLLTGVDELLILDEYCRVSNITLCIKRHPRQRKYLGEDEKLTNIIFISNEDLNENNIKLYSLLQYTDGLISDYSSVSIDYLLLDKPMGFALQDYQQYKQVRGFVFSNPLEYMPGRHMYSLEDLEEFIREVVTNQDSEKDRRHSVIAKTHNFCPNYCEHIWNTILKLR